jgi:TetR/AcrR family transcriptional regulator, mexJK operon transcriptional repressor
MLQATEKYCTIQYTLRPVEGKRKRAMEASGNGMSDISKRAAAVPAMRPRLEARRRAFMEAATAVFLEKGYAGATLDDVIARSGGSRQTLYALFGGKEGLFGALVAERAASIFEPFPADELRDRPPEEVLSKLGARYIEIVTTAEALGLFRMVVAESAAKKEIAELFWRSGPSDVRTLISRYLEGQIQRQGLRLDDPEQAARQFMGMLLGTLHMECVLGLRHAPAPAEIETHVRSVVRQFLDGCRGNNA